LEFRVRQYRLPCLEELQLLVGDSEIPRGLETLVEIDPLIVSASVGETRSMAREERDQVDFTALGDFRGDASGLLTWMN
jgi:hypothetical protein